MIAALLTYVCHKRLVKAALVKKTFTTNSPPLMMAALATKL